MPLAHHYLRLVWSRWKLVAALVTATTLFAWGFSALVLAQRPTFESAARLNIVPTSEELGYANRFVRGSTFDGGSVLLQTYAEFAHTRPVVAPIVDRWIAEQAARAGQSPADWIAANTQAPALSPGRIVSALNYGAAPAVPLRQDLIDGLIEHTRIEAVEGTYLIRIGVGWDDPEGAAWFANALADAIVARAETMSRTSGQEIAGSLAARLAAKQAELAQVQRRSRDIKMALGVVDIDRQKQSLLEAQLTEQSQLTGDRAALESSESQVAGLRRQTGGKLSSAQQVLEQTLAVEAPKAAGIRQGIAVREGRIGQIGRQLAALGGQEDAVKTLDGRAVALQAEVAALTERVSFSQTENLANAPRIQLIERAVPPLVRSSPKTLLNTALGFVAGCALAGCALLLLGAAPVADRAKAVDGRVEGRAEDRSDPGSDTTPALAPEPAATQADAPLPTFRQWRGPARAGLRARGGGGAGSGGAALALVPVFEDEHEPLTSDTAPPAPTIRIVPSRPEPVEAAAPEPSEPVEQTAPAAGEPEPIATPAIPGVEVIPPRPIAAPIVPAAGEATGRSIAGSDPAGPVSGDAGSIVSPPAIAGSAAPRLAADDVPPTIVEHPAASLNTSHQPAMRSQTAAPLVDRDHVFPTVLPRPADGQLYRGAEIALHGRAIGRWLAEPLAADGRPLLVAGAGDDRSVQQVYQLLYDHLRGAGLRVRTLDVSRGQTPRVTRDARKPLLYAGGFGESGRRAVLAEASADTECLLVVPRAPGEDAATAVEAFAASIAGHVQGRPHVLVLDD